LKKKNQEGKTKKNKIKIIGGQNYKIKKIRGKILNIYIFFRISFFGGKIWGLSPCP